MFHSYFPWYLICRQQDTLSGSLCAPSTHIRDFIFNYHKPNVFFTITFDLFPNYEQHGSKVLNTHTFSNTPNFIRCLKYENYRLHKLKKIDLPKNPSNVLLGLWILRASWRTHTTLCPPGDCLPQKTNPTLKQKTASKNLVRPNATKFFRSIISRYDWFIKLTIRLIHCVTLLTS